MKKNNKKGFTLAELLVVVAIIGVLAAISIPVFSNAVNKSQHAADVANVRAAYSEALVEAMADGGDIKISEADLKKNVSAECDVKGEDGKKITIVSGDITTEIKVDNDVTFVADGTGEN